MPSQRIPDPMVPAISPGHPDTALVDLWNQRNDLLWPLRLGEIDFETDQESDAYHEPITELERRIMTMPAHTIVGLSIKARLLWEYGNPGRKEAPWAPIEDPGDGAALDDRTLYSLASDTVRLAMSDNLDAQLIALCDDWERLEAENVDKGDDATEEDHARLKALENQILDTPAQTTTGVFAKLRLVNVIWDDEPEDPKHFETTDQRLMCSAALDADKLSERLGAGS